MNDDPIVIFNNFVHRLVVSVQHMNHVIGGIGFGRHGVVLDVEEESGNFDLFAEIRSGFIPDLFQDDLNVKFIKHRPLDGNVPRKHRCA